MNRLIPYIAIMLLSAAIGFWAGAGLTPTVPEPVVRYVAPGQLPFKAPTLAATPSLRLIIGTRTDTVKTAPKTVHVPVDMTRYNLAAPQPISMGSGQVHYRYFDTVDGRYKVDLFDIPRPRWHLRAYADLFAWDALGQTTLLPGLRAEAGYKRLTAQGGAYFDTKHNQPIIMAGVSLRLTGH